MIKKEKNLAVILVLLLAFVIIGIPYLEKSNELNGEVQEVIIEEEPVKITETSVNVPIETKPVVSKKPITLSAKKEVVIQISRFDFDKPKITIDAGTTVIWENIDSRRHIITNKNIGLFKTIRKSLKQGERFDYTFNEPGVYEILEANFGIKGVIIVKEKSNIVTGMVANTEELNENMVVKNINFVPEQELVVKKTGSNQIVTGNMVKNVEVDSLKFILFSINLFALTMAALIIGFYLSRNKKR